MSQAFAERVRRDAGDDTAAQIERAWWLALSRPPTDSERSLAEKHLQTQRQNMAERAAAGGATLSGGKADRQALESLCHVLLNLNEFIYVD